MGANVKIAEAMGETTKTMGSMNRIMNPAKMAKDMQEFAMANEKMGMTEEMSKFFLTHVTFSCFYFVTPKNYIFR